MPELRASSIASSNIYGAWQVTVPEVVDATKWQRMYDTYVADRHRLQVRDRFSQANNLHAFQAITVAC